MRDRALGKGAFEALSQDYERLKAIALAKDAENEKLRAVVEPLSLLAGAGSREMGLAVRVQWARDMSAYLAGARRSNNPQIKWWAELADALEALEVDDDDGGHGGLPADQAVA